MVSPTTVVTSSSNVMETAVAEAQDVDVDVEDFEVVDVDIEDFEVVDVDVEVREPVDVVLVVVLEEPDRRAEMSVTQVPLS